MKHIYSTIITGNENCPLMLNAEFRNANIPKIILKCCYKAHIIVLLLIVVDVL